MSAQLPQDTDMGVALHGYSIEEEEKAPKEREEAFWLGLAASNFNTARNFQDSSLIVQWERNADHFNSRHFRRSAYNSRLYKGRSKLFRPLSRASERAASAQCAQAHFSNVDALDIEPKNQNDELQLAAARMMKAVIHDRLRNSIPWYLTVMGAFQDTRVYGPCVSYTQWEYEEEEITVEKPVMSLAGTPVAGETKKETQIRVLVDRPVIDMVPPENILIDPACDWRDPINTSPYIVRLIPMYVVDIESRMEKINVKTGEPEWRTYTREQILSASGDKYNTVRQAREGDNRQDKTDSQEYAEFKVVWVHQNFVRIAGSEWVYFTLGTQFLLSDIEPLEEAYLAGVRPFAYGFSVIETHKFSPSSVTELIASVQAAVNDIANLRIDNVRLALNKRYIIRRGAVIDLEALMRSVPGGGVMTEDVERDVKVIDTRDVTSSSYREQERLETEANDVSGAWLGGSIQNNRQLNETAKGMEMLSEGSSAISEMDIRTFTETWMKSQLKLLMLYIQAYESDEVIFNNAFEESLKDFKFIQEAQGEDREKIKQELFRRVKTDTLQLNVNVGLGATSPVRKAETLNSVITAIAQVPDQMARVDWDEVTKEQMSYAGFQDGARFLKGDEGEDNEITEEMLEDARQQGIEEGKDQIKLEEIKQKLEMERYRIDQDIKMRQLELELKERLHMQSQEFKSWWETLQSSVRRDEIAAREANRAKEIAAKEAAKGKV